MTSRIFLDALESGVSLHLVNSFTMAEAARNPDLASVLKKDLLICDGKPLAFLIRRKHAEFQNIRGVDLMRNILSLSPPTHGHFFLGGEEKTLRSILLEASKMNSNLNIKGVLAPPIIDRYSEYIDNWVNVINKSGATIIWVGLGTPKQDFVCHELAKRCRVVAIPVGAAFDFIGKTKKEAPILFQRFYLEWLYRLFKEPRRLLKRYIHGNLRFIFFILFGK